VGVGIGVLKKQSLIHNGYWFGMWDIPCYRWSSRFAVQLIELSNVHAALSSFAMRAHSHKVLNFRLGFFRYFISGPSLRSGEVSSRFDLFFSFSTSP
jgi:hypothetical protein